MTKQFTYNVNKNCIEYDGDFVAYLNSVDGFRIANKLNVLLKENKQLKQRIKSRLHYYHELCNEFDKDDGFTYNIVKRIVEDLEDILK